ncbi:hypothetical protein HGM15179_020007 [Zosterops borbonicus]|uniref:Uncharacterized protein n=1 Tax=Zosterops borbonicus TaxID=364589 RepID=A0A8K1DAG4_9PASS|nr:hypothetical protein HGM15179_020007 [Zosterops borbonicus]
MAEKKSLEAAKHLDQMLSELERHRAVGAVLMKEDPGSSGSVPASAAGREVMSGAVTGGNCSSGLEACHRRGKNKSTGYSNSLEESKQLDQILSEVERRHEMDQKALLKAAVPEGNNASVPTSSAQMEEEPDSATEDVISRTGAEGQDPVRLPKIVCPQDVRRSCMIGTVVTMFTAPIVLVGCYFGLRKLYEMRR